MMMFTILKGDAAKYLAGVHNRHATEWNPSMERVKVFHRMFRSLHSTTTSNHTEGDMVRGNTRSHYCSRRQCAQPEAVHSSTSILTDTTASQGMLLCQIEKLWKETNQSMLFTCGTTTCDKRELFVMRGRGADVDNSVAAVKMCEGNALWARSHNFDGKALQTVFDGVVHSKQFIDRSMAYCFLCNEPVGNLGSHCGWWDHVTRHAWLRLCATYRRASHPERVIVDAFTAPSDAVAGQGASCRRRVPKRYSMSPRLLGNRLPTLVRWVNHIASSRDMSLMLDRYGSTEVQRALSDGGAMALRLPALDDPQAVSRRCELAAMIVKLVDWGAVRFSFCESQSGANGNGERCFRGTVSRLAVMMLPPSGAQAMTRVQQKIWGRKTIELLFDELQLGTLIQRNFYNLKPSTTKNEKGEAIRQLIFELHCLCDESNDCSEGDMMVPDVSEAFQAATMSSTAASSPPSQLLVQLIAEQALHRLAFELMYLRTCLNLEETFALWADFGFPTTDDTEGRAYY